MQKFKEFKIKVCENNAKETQEALFSLGYSWAEGYPFGVNYCAAPNLFTDCTPPNLFTDCAGYITCSSQLSEDIFNTIEKVEVTLEHLKSLRNIYKSESVNGDSLVIIAEYCKEHSLDLKCVNGFVTVCISSNLYKVKNLSQLKAVVDADKLLKDFRFVAN